jgi:hypothetical protein
MTAANERPYRNEVAVLTTMHGKEKVIAPVLKDGLGLNVRLAGDVNTDRFGTFSRDIDRAGSQLDAARAKIAAGFEYAPSARVGLASEGSFGPHPFIPFLTVARELVLIIDRETGLELAGHDVGLDTNFGNKIVSDVGGALAFSESVKFPDHGLLVMAVEADKPKPQLALFKQIEDQEAIATAVQKIIDLCGAAFIEADMRAHRNPTRMAAIARAAGDLVRRFNSRCPDCKWPGFGVTERIKGLPCSWCGEPTEVIRLEALRCHHCGYRKERPVPGSETADPSQCAQCNP